MNLLVWVLGCAGEPPPPPLPATGDSVVPAELVARTWQVVLADDATRAPFEGKASWTAYYEGRRGEALQAFAAEGDATGLARSHVEFAQAYALATRMAALATVEVYGKSPMEGDPREVDYLLGVSGTLLGDAGFAARRGRSAGTTAAEADAAWLSAPLRPAVPPWIPPDLGGVATPGTLPTAGSVPHFRFHELPPGDREVPAEDPGTSWALMDWHRRAALLASPALEPAIPFLLLPWAGPEAPEEAAAPKELPLSMLFLSLATTAPDLLFFGGIPGPQDVEAMRQIGSPYGMIAASCRAAEAAGFAECVAKEADALADAIKATMAVSGERPFHRGFAARARVGALANAAQVAELLGEGAECPETATGLDVSCVEAAAPWRAASGRLRVLALDEADAAALADPVVWLWVAAWDAGNRNTVRATELLFRAEKSIPGLDAARVPVDALHLRVSRNAAPGQPMH